MWTSPFPLQTMPDRDPSSIPGGGTTTRQVFRTSRNAAAAATQEELLERAIAGCNPSRSASHRLLKPHDRPPSARGLRFYPIRDDALTIRLPPGVNRRAVAGLVASAEALRAGDLLVAVHGAVPAAELAALLPSLGAD